MRDIPAPAENPPSRMVVWIQSLISFLAPPLHSLHWKIFLLCLAAIFLPGIYFAWNVGQSIERSHLRSTEQGMIDTALVIAASTSEAPVGDFRTLLETRKFVFGGLDPNLRIVIYSPDGRTLHDTEGKYLKGEDRSADRDVRKAMEGQYGARWARDSYRRVVILFVTVPVIQNGQVTSLVSVIKATSDVRKSVIRSLIDLAWPAALALVLASVVSFAISIYLTRIIQNLADRATRVAAGETGVQLETWSKSELGGLARALEKMRLRLEGKKYVEEMALTLSHEIKTPISAIRGAAEILEQTEDPSVKKKFLSNIFAETGRLAAIVENFLALSRIENAPPDRASRASLPEVANAVATAFSARAGEIHFETSLSKEPAQVAMPADQLRRMMEAVLENAFQFTPPGKRVIFSTGPSDFSVWDEGPGIPVELREKVFDRFFTTVNPLTGRRGTGMGLAIVRSLADRYGATATIECEQGTRVTVKFTKIS